MKGLAAIVFLTLAAPASAAGYKVVLSPPEGTEVVRGYGGLHAVDDRTDTTLVRLISPGSDVRERGTIRVLVMNKGAQTFQFGPGQVQLELADGTKLKPVSINEFIRGAELIEREMGRARTIDQRNRANLSELARQGGGSSGGVPAELLSRRNRARSRREDSISRPRTWPFQAQRPWIRSIRCWRRSLLRRTRAGAAIMSSICRRGSALKRPACR